MECRVVDTSATTAVEKKAALWGIAAVAQTVALMECEMVG
jgi:hypothetical protein